jgi:L,D-transpeptidase ErfK/SrfK
MLAPFKKTCVTASVLAVLSLAAINSAAVGAKPLPHQLSGGESAYTVQRGDSLTLIGARFGVSPWVLSALNMLDPKAPVKPGQQIRIDNRHVVPTLLPDGIIVNVPQRMLFVIHSGELVSAYPVAVGRTDPKWRTPASRFTVVRLDKNPVWLVPVSIQHEMAEEGEEVETRVKPGPENPLGHYRIKLSIPDYAIHDTIAPASIYSFRTHGCIRLFPSNAEAFFAQAKVGMIGETIYEPVLLAQLADGRIFLEADRDVYKRAPDPFGVLRDIAQSFNLGHIIDWREAGAVIRHHEGIAREITVRQAVP